MALPSFCHTEFLGKVITVFMFMFIVFMVFRSDFVKGDILFKNIFLSVRFAVLKFSQSKISTNFRRLDLPLLQVERGKKN